MLPWTDCCRNHHVAVNPFMPYKFIGGNHKILDCSRRVAVPHLFRAAVCAFVPLTVTRCVLVTAVNLAYRKYIEFEWRQENRKVFSNAQSVTIIHVKAASRWHTGTHRGCAFLHSSVSRFYTFHHYVFPSDFCVCVELLWLSLKLYQLSQNRRGASLRITIAGWMRWQN